MGSLTLGTWRVARAACWPRLTPTGAVTPPRAWRCRALRCCSTASSARVWSRWMSVRAMIALPVAEPTASASTRRRVRGQCRMSRSVGLRSLARWPRALVCDPAGLKLELDRHRQPPRRTAVQVHVHLAGLRPEELERLKHGGDIPPLAVAADIPCQSAVKLQASLLVIADEADKQILIAHADPRRSPPVLASGLTAPRAETQRQSRWSREPRLGTRCWWGAAVITGNCHAADWGKAVPGPARSDVGPKGRVDARAANGEDLGPGRWRDL